MFDFNLFSFFFTFLCVDKKMEKRKKKRQKNKNKSLYITIYVSVCVCERWYTKGNCWHRWHELQGRGYIVKGTWITKGKQDAFKHLIFFSVLILLLIIIIINMRHWENMESHFACSHLSQMFFFVLNDMWSWPVNTWSVGASSRPPLPTVLWHSARNVRLAPKPSSALVILPHPHPCGGIKFVCG